MNGSRFSWAILLFWFFQNGHFERIQTTTIGESSLIGQTPPLLLARVLWLVNQMPAAFAGESALIGQTPPLLLARWRESCDWLKNRRVWLRDDRRLARALWLVKLPLSTLLSNGDFRLNKGFSHGKYFFHPLVILPLNVRFWSAHHVHGTKLHPKCGSYDVNSMEVKVLRYLRYIGNVLGL